MSTSIEKPEAGGQPPVDDIEDHHYNDPALIPHEVQVADQSPSIEETQQLPPESEVHMAEQIQERVRQQDIDPNQPQSFDSEVELQFAMLEEMNATEIDTQPPHADREFHQRTALDIALEKIEKLNAMLLQQECDAQEMIDQLRSEKQDADLLCEDLYSAIGQHELVLERREAEHERLAATLEITQARVASLEVELEDIKHRLEVSQSRCKVLEIEKDAYSHVRSEKSERDEEAKTRQEETRRHDVFESIRKMREMEREDKERKEAEAQAEAVKKDSEARQRQEHAEAQRRMEAQREEDERKRQEQWRSATARERRACEARDASWSTTMWSAEQAFSRFHALRLVFMDEKYSVDKPLTLCAVPWPVFTSPNRLRFQNITFTAVEAFFQRFRREVGAQEYQDVIQATHRTFHPDKWKSRGLLTSVMDDYEREQLERCGNVVAQAITPLWKASRET